LGAALVSLKENDMAEDRDIKDVRVAVGRGLSARLAVERELPQQLLELLRQLEQREHAVRNGSHAAP
jgi:hypothetical protein